MEQRGGGREDGMRLRRLTTIDILLDTKMLLIKCSDARNDWLVVVCQVNSALISPCVVQHKHFWLPPLE